MIKNVINEHTKIEKSNISEETRKGVKDRLMNNKNVYKKIRTDRMVTQYKENQNNKCPTHHNETRVGVNQTDLVNLKVPYSENTKMKGFAPLMLEEISARNKVLTDVENNNYPKMMKILKAYEGDDKSFSP